MDDTKLRTLVQQELDWDPMVDATGIGVAVKDGVVTLTGHAPTYAQRVAAERAVKRVKGVRGLAQDIEVRAFDGSGASDDEVASRVLHTLDWNVSVPKNAVQVRVDEGHVILNGEVDYQYQRNVAEECLHGLRGVRKVTNHITVRPHPTAPDLKERIEEALDRQAHLEADKIQIFVQDGKVRLEGKVRAPYQREIVELAVWAAPGVEAVEDRIKIGL